LPTYKIRTNIFGRKRIKSKLMLISSKTGTCSIFIILNTGTASIIIKQYVNTQRDGQCRMSSRIFIKRFFFHICGNDPKSNNKKQHITAENYGSRGGL